MSDEERPAQLRDRLWKLVAHIVDFLTFFGTYSHSMRPQLIGPVHVLHAERQPMTETTDKPSGLVVSPRKAREYMKLPLNEQYAVLMALGDEAEYTVRYEEALEDFARLCHVRDLAHVGVNWHAAELVVATADVHMEDKEGVVRYIGDLLLHIGQNPPSYRVERLGGGYKNQQGDPLAHPHARQNNMFCMAGGNKIVLQYIVEGRCSAAVEILLRAVWMREYTVTRGYPFLDLEHWPKERNDDDRAED